MLFAQLMPDIFMCKEIATPGRDTQRLLASEAKQILPALGRWRKA